MPPRLRVAVVGGGGELARLLGSAGHDTFPVTTPEDIAAAELVLLDRDDCGWVSGGVDTLAPFVAPRQMFIHTALASGAQLLDAAETRGAIVMAAHNIFGNHWVTDAADELGESVIGLLIAEIGGVSHPVAEAARPVIAAALRLAALERAVRRDSFELLRSALPDADAFAGAYAEADPPELSHADPGYLERLYRAVDQPGVARLLADLERRNAQRLGDAEVELWAMSLTEKGLRDGI
ncbi:hypothetical protein [Corynebacterium liangguodongii]|uniref:CGL2689-like C-terminal domain-containing protein n=1 Tax=Corynebacterium liangguodongii TaxID=2079535 RepID=A0A2S0WFW4_9CORY|nr:hypothetical protein [Corynebacterium liangguodongii]AWB84659.1 hypothetical protein C3E79_09395 [Corynebacterium liangguodongii]PWB99667.1 hypothetical protein DF219_05175 [Corynebacterium liangguodongii]